MKSSTSQLACKTQTATHPSGRMQDIELGGLQDCFSDINTEMTQRDSTKIAYVAQLLSLRNVRHLSASQIVGRRFLLNMLQSLSELLSNSAASPNVQIAGWDADCKSKFLVYLLNCSFSQDLAKAVKEAAEGRLLSEQEIVSIGRWLDRNGLDISELGMIQPGLFRPSNALPRPKGNSKFQPKFADLMHASHSRNIDYLAGAFFGLSQEILGESSSKPSASQVASANQGVSPGRGEAIASIFDVRNGFNSAQKQSRLRAIAIPTTNGEPLFALSFSGNS